MPEPVTFITPETPALSPENEEALKATEQSSEQGDQLLAGKYKSVEELEKAYKELQSKLGGRPATAQEEGSTEPADEEDGEEGEEEEPPAGNARELYGEFIGSRLEEANIDFSSMADRWQQTGKLEDADYGELEGAGFTRDMVDAYLAGLNYKAAQDSQLTAQEITSIKAEYGGEKGYSDLIAWASTNLPADEVDAFNTIVNSQPLSTVKLAIAGLHAKYTAAVGREPKLIGGRSSRSNNDRFESTAQLVAAMSDPRYKDDPAYRRKIEDKLSRSSIL